MKIQTDGQMDRRADGQTDSTQTDVGTSHITYNLT